MHITEIKIMKRRNLGNYEHKEVTMTASLEEGEQVNNSVSFLEALISQALIGDIKQVAAKVVEPVKVEETPAIVEEAPKKKAPRKKAPKKSIPAVIVEEPKEELPPPTIQEMMELCRATAGKLNSGDKVKSLIELICGVSSLKDADPTKFAELKKTLEDA
jgi:hypothetical protein